MKGFLIILILFISSSNLIAQIRFDDAFMSTTLENQMEIFRDSTNSMTINDILTNKQKLSFSISKEPVPNFVYDHTRHWVHFKIQNTSNKPLPFFIRIHHSYIDTVGFYLVKNNQVIDNNEFRWKIPYLKRQNRDSRLPVARFEIEQQVVYDVYFMARRTESTWNLAIEVFSMESFYKRERIESTIYGLLVGGMILALFMALFLFLMYKESLYLYYLFYIFSTTFSILGVAGFTNYYLGSKYRLLTGPESYSFYLVCTVIFNILFTQNLFNIKINGPKWIFILGNLSIFFCIILNLIFIVDYHNVYNPQINPLVDYTSLLYILIVVLTIITQIKRNHPIAKFYLVAFLPLLVLIVVNITSDMGFIERSPYLIFAAPPCVLFEIIVLFLGIAYRLYFSQKEKQNLEKEMIIQQFSTQEAERKRLAQDLHDDLGGTLSAIKGRITNEETNLETIHLVEKAIEDLRIVSRNLLPPELSNEGLAKAIHHTIERLQRASSIKFTYITFGKQERMSEERELNVYRIISEILNNIIKHSQATSAIIQIVFYEENLHISVEDNGIGIKTDPNTWGIGLKNIHSRVEFLKAKMLIDSNEKGTTIILDIPYH